MIQPRKISCTNPPQGTMGTPITINGVFDSVISQAITNIQSYFAPATMRIVDTENCFLIGQGIGSKTPYDGPIYGSHQLQQDNPGGDVTVLQPACFRYVSIIGHPAHGIFDSATASAVLRI
ncbi:MAG: hypothetical protein M1499_02430 [Firmicutes bacterium]|nr:hypothetical protein [Bacillota bacterium]